MELNAHLTKSYNKLLQIFADLDEHPASIASLKYRFFSAASDLRRCAYGEKEDAFVRECELKMLPYYQKALEKEYEKFKAQKAIGCPDYASMDFWILTVDKNGNPTKTTVVDVQKGYPIYADGCTDVEILRETQMVGSYRYELNRWLKSNKNLYELKAAAEELKKKGSLGMSDPPTPNYDLDGLVGGQLDAAAWQNYAIANGMVRRTDYDISLDNLLEYIDKCIDFYEKAMSIV